MNYLFKPLFDKINNIIIISKEIKTAIKEILHKRNINEYKDSPIF